MPQVLQPLPLSSHVTDRRRMTRASLGGAIEAFIVSISMSHRLLGCLSVCVTFCFRVSVPLCVLSFVHRYSAWMSF